MKKEKPPLLTPQEAKAQGLWFLSKRYGYGWIPFTWQGWAVILAFFVIVFTTTRLTLRQPNPTIVDMAYFLKVVIASLLVLLYICYKKGEKAYWRWGK
jgi:hypothetical protein